MLIAELRELDEAALRAAVSHTFAERGTHPVPAQVPAPPASWAAQCHRLAESIRLPGDLEHGHETAAALLAPVLAGAA